MTGPAIKLLFRERPLSVLAEALYTTLVLVVELLSFPFCQDEEYSSKNKKNLTDKSFRGAATVQRVPAQSILHGTHISLLERRVGSESLFKLCKTPHGDVATATQTNIFLEGKAEHVSSTRVVVFL